MSTVVINWPVLSGQLVKWSFLVCFLTGQIGWLYLVRQWYISFWNSDGCKYKKLGRWSECDPDTGLKTREVSLKKGDPRTCLSKKLVTKPCAVKRKNAGIWNLFKSLNVYSNWNANCNNWSQVFCWHRPRHLVISVDLLWGEAGVPREPFTIAHAKPTNPGVTSRGQTLNHCTNRTDTYICYILFWRNGNVS